MVDPTPAQSRALTLAHLGALNQTTAHNTTIDACAHRGWITWHDPAGDPLATAALTARGKAALDTLLDPPHLLGRLLGYTTRPDLAVDPSQEPEAIRPPDLERIQHYAGLTTHQWLVLEHAQRHKDRQLLHLEDRLSRLRHDAHHAGINLSSEFRALEQLMQPKALAERPGAALLRIEATERKLDTRRLAA